MRIINRPILPATEYAQSLGFSPDKFSGYLWDYGQKTLVVSMLISLNEGQGNTRSFIENLIAKDWTVHVPTPTDGMKVLLRKLGFKSTYKDDEQLSETFEVWVSPNSEEFKA